MLFLSTSLAPATSYKYSSDIGKKEIVFPEAYSVEKMDEEDYVTYKVSSQKDKIVFFANYTIHELELADAEQLSKTSLEAFNEAVEGEIVSSGDWKVGSSKGLQAVIEMSATKHKVNYRAILVGNIQYQLVVFSEAENWNQQLSNDFMQSFTLKN